MYQSQITRARKGAILLLLDQSGSMAEEILFEGRTITKAEALCSAVNTLLEEIVSSCRRERFVGDYFDLGIIGYSGTEAKSLLGKGFVSVVDIDSMDTTITPRIVSRTLPTGESFQTIIERRSWIAPAAKGRTPMGEALKLAQRMCAAWCRRNTESFPPIVINISDGEATDATHQEIRTLSEEIRKFSTQDGNVLMMNIHLSTADHAKGSIILPSESEPRPSNRHFSLLYDISSTLPEIYNEAIERLHGGTPPFRAICFNAPITELIGLLAIGSLSTDMII